MFFFYTWFSLFKALIIFLFLISIQSKSRFLLTEEGINICSNDGHESKELTAIEIIDERIVICFSDE